jgi:NCS1 family nucleobase:cation symporter-1
MLRPHGVILAVAADGMGIAAWLGHRPTLAIGNYEYFLLLLGSVFVPLFGVFVADYFLLGRRDRLATGTREDDLVSKAGGVRVNGRALVAWVAGFLLYQWSVPTPLARWQDWMQTFFHRWLHLPFPLWGSAAGASIPAFGAALLVYLALSLGRASRGGRTGARSPQPAVRASDPPA